MTSNIAAPVRVVRALEQSVSFGSIVGRTSPKLESV
jgi:hypothetical protein